MAQCLEHLPCSRKAAILKRLGRLQSFGKMRRLHKAILFAVICIALMLLLALSFDTPNRNYDVTIDFIGNSESSHGPIATLRLQNDGRTTVRFNAYCTIYWTNRLGIPTNTFFKHNQGYAILPPGESSLIRVPHPPDAKTWDTSFTYQVRPSPIARLVSRVTFLLPGTWTADNSFVGRFGPLITNPVPVVGGLPLLQN